MYWEVLGPAQGDRREQLLKLIEARPIADLSERKGIAVNRERAELFQAAARLANGAHAIFVVMLPAKKSPGSNAIRNLGNVAPHVIAKGATHQAGQRIGLSGQLVLKGHVAALRLELFHHESFGDDSVAE